MISRPGQRKAAAGKVPGDGGFSHQGSVAGAVVSQTNPSGSVNGSAAQPTAIRCEPSPSGRRPASLASALRRYSASVRLGRPWWWADKHADVLGVECSGEPRVPVAQHEPQRTKPGRQAP
jgi:hypothetical protein